MKKQEQRVQYGTVVKGRNGWRAFFHPPMDRKTKLVVADGAATYAEAELALVIVKTEYLILRMLRECGYEKTRRIIEALDWCEVMGSEIAR